MDKPVIEIKNEDQYDTLESAIKLVDSFRMQLVNGELETDAIESMWLLESELVQAAMTYKRQFYGGLDDDS